MSSFAAAAPPRWPVDLRHQLRMVLMREASPTARSLEHPRRGFLAGAALRAAPNSRQDATRRALGRDRVRCRRRDRLGRTAARFAARVMSYSQCQTAQSSSFPRALLRPGSFSSLSLLSVGWVERQRHPSPALAGPGPMGFAHGAQPILRNSYLPFLRSRDIRARVLPSFSASDPRPRGWRSAGRRYPLSCHARNRATPRLRSVGRPAQPERRLAALHRDGFGPAPRSAPELPPARFAVRTSRARLTDRGRDATSRSAFRKRF